MKIEQLMVATAAMRLQVATMSEEVNDMRRMGLQDALIGWSLTRDQYEELDDCRKEIYALLETLSKGILPEMMAENKTKTITLDNVRKRFTVSHRLTCSMLEGMKEAGIAWLQGNGGSAIPQLTVNSQTLSSFAKARIEKEGLDMPSDIFKVSTVDNISATKV